LLGVIFWGDYSRAHVIDKAKASVLDEFREINTEVTLNLAKQVWNLYFHIHKFGLFRSIYYFSFYAFNAIKKRIYS